MSAYGWIITKDHLADAGDVDSAVGTYGPSNVAPSIVTQLKRGYVGHAFRMYDDDGELYYSGRFIGDVNSDDAFGPLDDFGGPNAGAVAIAYRERGKWVEL